MPRVGCPPDPTTATAMLLWERFKAPQYWARSRKNNLWRNYENVTVSIFQRPSDGSFGWSIADDEGVRFSRGGFATEDDCMDGLGEQLGVGY